MALDQKRCRNASIRNNSPFVVTIRIDWYVSVYRSFSERYNSLSRVGLKSFQCADVRYSSQNIAENSANCALTNECRRIHANITNDLKRTFTNDNEFGFSPIRQYAHDDVGTFSSMCEEAFKLDFS